MIQKNTLDSIHLKYPTYALFQMNTQADCKQFDIKYEEVLLPATELKIEPEDIKNEIISEEEECDGIPEQIDVKYEIQLSPNYVTSVKTTSEVAHIEDEHKSPEEEEIKIAAIVDKPESYKANLVEEKCEIHVCDFTRVNTCTCDDYKNSFESNFPGIYVKTADQATIYDKCKNCTLQIFRCNICRKSFSKNSNFTNIPRGEKLYNCKFCTKSYSSKSNLTRHTRSHLGEKPFSCNLCSKSFSFKSTLIKHKNLHGEKPFTCNVCSNSFSTEVDINRHMRIHSGERPFTCDICRLSFYQKGNLVAHMRIHLGEKLFTCTICSKSFSRKFHLVEHTRCHTGEKPYKCKICERAFTVKQGLFRHMNVHSDEKPFKCNICVKSFCMKQYINRHMQMHADEKLFQCDICNKSFAGTINLSRHKRKHKIINTHN